MMGKWYKITGISKELLEVWEDDLRHDVIVCYKDSEPCLKIRLNFFEAIRMKLAMIRSNMHTPLVLRLEKIK